MDQGADDLEFDPVARVNKLPLSYLLFNLIPPNFLKHNSERSAYISSLVNRLKGIWGSKPFFDSFTSGSMAEGLGLSVASLNEGSSDLDIMMIYPMCYKRLDDSSNDLHPGYVRLILDESEKGVTYMPNTGHDEWWKPTDGDGGSVPFTIKGPSINAALLGPEIGAIDFVVTLPCPVWPKLAEEWISRPRPSGWPTKQLIHQITSDGCHVVPVAHSRSSFPLYDWRYSFSKAELLLAKSLSFHQKTCYLLFKLLAMHATKTTTILKSYYLKNIMFHCCDLIPATLWKPKLFASRLFDMIDLLLDNLEKGDIPHYFIKKNNLISHLYCNDIEMLKQVVFSLRQSTIDHLIKVDNSNVIRFNLRNSINFEYAFKEVIQCLPQGIKRPSLHQAIDQVERRLALSLLRGNRILLASDCFEDHHAFFYAEDGSHKKDWKSRFISFLDKSVEHLPPGPLISLLVILPRGELSTVDTTTLQNAIKSIVKKRFSYHEIRLTFPNDHLSRAMYLLYYSVYYLLTGNYDTAYLHAKTVLEDTNIERWDTEPGMEVTLSFEPVILEKVQSVSGINQSTIKMKALFLAAKSIKRTSFKNKKGHLFNTDEDTFRNKESNFLKVDVLMIALIYIETDQFIAAAKFLCMEYHNTLYGPRKVWQLRQHILICLLLELLQISTICEFYTSPSFKDMAERTLDLILFNIHHDVDSMEEIGEVFDDLARLYGESTLTEFHEERHDLALDAAWHCKTYIEKLTEKALYLSENWA